MKFKITTLGEYAQIQGGYAYKSKDFNATGKHPVLKIKNIRFGVIDYSETSYIDTKIASATKGWKTQEGDILISMTGSGPNAPQSLVGRVARVWGNEPTSWINQRVGRLVLKDKSAIHPDFLFYVLSSKQSQEYLVSNSSGSANQANISSKTIESLPCPKIDFESSFYIAKFLRNLDKKTIINNAINQTLEQMAQAIFKSWFVDFEPVKAKIAALEAGGNQDDALLAAMQAIAGEALFANNPTNADAATQLAQLKANHPEQYASLRATAELFQSAMQDSELGEIPQGWNASKLCDEFDVTMGQSPPGHTYNEAGDGVPFFQGRRDFGVRYPSNRVYCTEPKRMAKAGDTLLSVRAPVGDTNLARTDCCIGRGIAALRHKSGCSSFTYYSVLQLGQALSSYDSEGTVFGSINQKNLNSLLVITPPKEILSIFSQIVGATDSRIKSLSEEASTLAELRDTLLPKLLSGELSVAAAEDQLANLEEAAHV